MVKKKAPKESKLSEEKVLEMLYEKVGTPENPMRVSCVNVFGSNYRVNIWQSLNHPFLASAGFISASYFFTIKDDFVIIK
jgi:hypothetical protein